MKQIQRKSQSFSLIEVLVFVAVLSVFFVTSAAVVTVSLRNMKYNEHKIRAVRYAQEALEWIRGEKETDWNLFVINHSAGGSGKSYCFNSSPIYGWPGTSGDCGASYSLDSFFKRDVAITRLDNSCTISCQVRVNVMVQWKDIGVGHTVPIQSVMSIWE